MELIKCRSLIATEESQVRDEKIPTSGNPVGKDKDHTTFILMDVEKWNQNMSLPRFTNP
jgi:hypothetical protein